MNIAKNVSLLHLPKYNDNKVIAILVSAARNNDNKVIAILALLGIATIVINTIQLGFLKTKFKREVNTLFVLIQHLCVADILNGVAVFIRALLILSQSLFNDGFNVDKIIIFIGTFSKNIYFCCIDTAFRLLVYPEDAKSCEK